MAYTVKQLLESKQFPDMRLVTCKENLNQEIKGIRIIEIEDMERYLTVPVTGIIMNTLPYVLMIALCGVALIAFVGFKRRRLQK